MHGTPGPVLHRRVWELEKQNVVFRVQELGEFRIQGYGFTGLGVRVLGLGVKVLGLGFRDGHG